MVDRRDILIVLLNSRDDLDAWARHAEYSLRAVRCGFHAPKPSQRGIDGTRSTIADIDRLTDELLAESDEPEESPCPTSPTT